MKVTFENADKVNGLMTITVEEADFKENVEKTLKNYRKKANVPGFRAGQVPMSLIKRQVGTSVKVDEINKLVGQEIYKYVQENKIQMLGDPLPCEKPQPVDVEKDAPYTFVFDIAVAPEFEIKLSGHDKVDYYTIKVDDKLIDQQVDMYASRGGHYDKVDSYQENDMLKGDLRELDAEGNTKTLRSVGAKWSYLQSTKFGANAQPFYVMLDPATGRPLAGSRAYDEDIPAYIDFLKKGLANYGK